MVAGGAWGLTIGGETWTDGRCGGPGRGAAAAPGCPLGLSGHPDPASGLAQPAPGAVVSALRTCQIRCATVNRLSAASTYTAGASSEKCPSDAPRANTSPADRITTRTGRVARPTLHCTPSASARARV